MAGIPYWWANQAIPGGDIRDRLAALAAIDFSEIALGPVTGPGENWSNVIKEICGGPQKCLALDVAPSPIANENGRHEHNLAAPSPDKQQVAIAHLLAGVNLAREAGATLVLTPPGNLLMKEDWQGDLAVGLDNREQTLAEMEKARSIYRDQALDRCCRALHLAQKHGAGRRICLRNGYELAGLDRPADLTAIVEDLGRERISIWCDVAAAAVREEAGDYSLGELLDQLGPAIAGFTLGDGRIGQPGLVPGTGKVDFQLVADYLKLPGGSLPTILEISPFYGLSGLTLARRELLGKGL